MSLGAFRFGKAPDQRQQQMPLLIQLALQRRQCLLDLRKRSFLRHDVGLGDLSKLALAPKQVEQVSDDPDDLLRRRDLAA